MPAYPNFTDQVNTRASMQTCFLNSRSAQDGRSLLNQKPGCRSCFSVNCVIRVELRNRWAGQMLRLWWGTGVSKLSCPELI